MARSFKQSEIDSQAQENFRNRQTMRKMKRAQQRSLTENETDTVPSYGTEGRNYSPRTYR